jgi:tetratricopeptide (TPR) repeat protein
MYSIFRFSQKRSNASRLLSTKKRDLFKTKASGRPGAGDLIQSSRRMLDNSRLSREKRIKPWISPLLGESADVTQVLSTRRLPHKIQQLIAPFSSQALVEKNLFLGIGKTDQRNDQQIIRTHHLPAFQTIKLTALLSRGDAWGSQCKQEKNNADISAFYQTYRLYSSLPKQEKKTTDEGKKIKWTRSKWMMLLGGLGVLLLLVFIYKMKNPLIFADTKEEDGLEQLRNAVMVLQTQEDNVGAIEVLTAYIAQHPQSTRLWALYVARGDEYYDNGDLDKARLDYDAALAINPKDAETLNNRGTVWCRKGDLEKALKDFDAALVVNPEYSDVFYNRGAVWRAKGDIEKALRDYDAALAINPEYAEALNNRGLVWRAKGDIEKALKDFDAALAINPEDAEILNNRGTVWSDKGDIEKALKDYDAALALNPEYAVALNNRGLVWSDKGDLEKALKDFDAALALNPEDAMAFNNRGNVWSDKGDIEKALADYDAALALNPEDATALNNRGSVWSDKGDIEKALKDYNAALAINSEDSDALYNRGNLWRNKGDIEKALEDYNAALAINPEDFDVFYSRGNLWSNKGDLEKALEDYNAALAINPEDSEVLYNRGNVWSAKGNLEKALKNYDAALAINSGDAETLNNRGTVWCRKGDIEKALKDYNAALAINPEYAAALNNRGSVWHDKGEWDKALDDYDKAFAIKQDIEQVLFGRGMAWQAKGELYKAKDAYDQALAVNPEHLGALFNCATVWVMLGNLNKANEGFDQVLSLDFRSDYKQQLTLVKKKIKAFNEGKRQPDTESQDNDGQQTGLSIGPYDPKPNPLSIANFETLREKQIELFNNQEREYNKLVTEVEKGNKSFVIQAIKKKKDLEQPKVIEHDRWLTYQTPIREARTQWACSSKEEDEDRYDILKALVQHRCVSHRCFGEHDMNKFIEQGLKKCDAEKFQRSQKIVHKLFQHNLDTEHEAAINLVLNEKLGTTWSDVYLRGQKNRVILIAHLNGIPVSQKKLLGYGKSLGWRIRDSLLLRFKADYLFMIAHQQMMVDRQMMKDDTTEIEEELELLKQEMVILQNLYRDTDVTLMLGDIRQKEERKPLLDQHAKSIVHHIQQTKNTEYTVWGGYSGHTLFVDVIKKDKKYYLKVDNLGNGVKRHQSDEQSGETLYYPCLLNAVGLDELALEMYIGQLLETRVTKIKGAKKKKLALDKIYRGVRSCVDHRSEEAGLTSALKKHTATWESERQQQTTDCVLRGYAVSSKSRLNVNKSPKSPGFFKECDDVYLNMRDFLDRYGLS